MSHHTHIKIRGYHLDLYQHVNNARYLEFLEEARWSFFEQHSDLAAFVSSGLAFVVVNINIHYRYPASMGDELIVHTRIQSIGQRKGLIEQRITLAGSHKSVANAEVTFVLFSAEQNKAIVIDGKLREQFEEVMQKQDH